MTAQHPADLHCANDVCAIPSHLSRLGHVVSSQLRLGVGWGGGGGGGRWVEGIHQQRLSAL